MAPKDSRSRVKVYDEDWDGGSAPLDFDKIANEFPGEIDFGIAGRRIRERRLRLDLSVSQLADRCRLTRQTISKIESGAPFKYPTLRRLQFVLGLYWEDLVRPEPDCDFANFYDPESERWRPAYSKSRYTNFKASEEPIDGDNAEERNRLGTTGLQPFFSNVFGNHLPGGTIRSPGMMELYQPSWFDQHPGEECIYCLRGKVKMIVRDREFILTEGACLVFNAFEPHKYVPLEPSADGRPPLIFIVLAVSEADAQRGIRWWPSPEEIEAIQEKRRRAGKGGMMPGEW